MWGVREVYTRARAHPRPPTHLHTHLVCLKFRLSQNAAALLRKLVYIHFDAQDSNAQVGMERSGVLPISIEHAMRASTGEEPCALSYSCGCSRCPAHVTCVGRFIGGYFGVGYQSKITLEAAAPMRGEVHICLAEVRHVQANTYAMRTDVSVDGASDMVTMPLGATVLVVCEPRDCDVLRLYAVRVCVPSVLEAAYHAIEVVYTRLSIAQTACQRHASNPIRRRPLSTAVPQELDYISTPDRVCEDYQQQGLDEELDEERAAVRVVEQLADAEQARSGIVVEYIVGMGILCYQMEV